MTGTLAIIGGTGLTSIPSLEIVRREMVKTPYGPPSGPLTHGRLHGKPIVFLPRHGSRHTIPPHLINYKANIWALKSIGIEHVIAVAAVGGISDENAPGTIVIPDQIIDYTYSREHTFFEGKPGKVEHIDFTYPYPEKLRSWLINAAEEASLKYTDNGTYAAVQGPRLETAAEIQRLKRDGCSIVGMTGMPEASLAREAGIDYVCAAIIVNWAAGISKEGVIDLKALEETIQEGINNTCKLLDQALLSMRD